MNSLKLSVGFALGFSLVAVADVPAAVSFQYVAGSATYSGNVDSNVTIPLFLRETVTGTSTSLLASQGGLNGAGVSVTRSAALPTSPASVFAITSNAAFNESGPFTETAAGLARLLESRNTNTGFVAATVFPAAGVSDVLLGTLTVKTGLTAGQSTGFTVAPFDGFGGNTLTPLPNGYDLDTTSAAPAYTGAASATPFTFTVTAVPEPAAVLVLAVALPLLRRRR